MNTAIENTLKQCARCLDYLQMQLPETMRPTKLLSKPLEVVVTYIFSINNNTLLHIVDSHNKFQVMKRADGLSEEDLIRAAKILFKEFGLQQKTVSDAGMNFVSD